MADEADDPVIRLLDGCLDAAGQRRLAEDLQRDPTLRRQLRLESAQRARLARALRMPTQRKPLHFPWRAWLVAACVVLGVGGTLSAWLLLDDRPIAIVAEGTVVSGQNPTNELRDGQAFTTTAQASLVVNRTSRVDLEAGSSGTMHTSSHSTMRLDSGGIRLHQTPQTAPLLLDASTANIIASGEVSVRHLAVPEGDLPAIQVDVGQGYARIDAGDGQHEITAGQMRLVAPGGRIRARVSRVDAPHERTVVSATGGENRMRWHLDHQNAPLVDACRGQTRLSELPPGTDVVVHLARDGRQVSRIEAPDQEMSGTLIAWDEIQRHLTLGRGRPEVRESLPVNAAVRVDPGLVGRKIRLTVDPLPPHAVQSLEILPQPGGKTPAKACDTPPAKGR